MKFHNVENNKEKIHRPQWDDYFIEIASVIAKRATCLRRQYGAVIVKENKIISTGYNGAPVGEVNCTTLGTCTRQELKIKPGERYELCRSVHAEANAILQGCSNDMRGATIYIAGWDREIDNIAEAHPCMMCTRMIKNAMIKKVIYQKTNGSIITKYVEEIGG